MTAPPDATGAGGSPEALHYGLRAPDSSGPGDFGPEGRTLAEDISLPVSVTAQRQLRPARRLGMAAHFVQPA